MGDNFEVDCLLCRALFDRRGSFGDLSTCFSLFWINESLYCLELVSLLAQSSSLHSTVSSDSILLIVLLQFFEKIIVVYGIPT